MPIHSKVIEGLMLGSFLNQGRAPPARGFISKHRFHDQLVAGFEQAVKSLSVGPGMDTGAQINPLVSLAHRDKVAAYSGRRPGEKTPSLSAARLGRMLNGFWHSADAGDQPGRQAEPDARGRCSGPVVNLIRVASAEEALSGQRHRLRADCQPVDHQPAAGDGADAAHSGRHRVGSTPIR